jgi:hypothetical protein
MTSFAMEMWEKNRLYGASTRKYWKEMVFNGMPASSVRYVQGENVGVALNTSQYYIEGIRFESRLE